MLLARLGIGAPRKSCRTMSSGPRRAAIERLALVLLHQPSHLRLGPARHGLVPSNQASAGSVDSRVHVGGLGRERHVCWRNHVLSRRPHVWRNNVRVWWSSWLTMTPIGVGAVGLPGFHAYGYCIRVANPCVPPHVFSNRTSGAAFYMVVVSSMLLKWV